MDETPPSEPAGNKPKPLYLCNPFVKAALVKGNFKTIVQQPKYADVNEVSPYTCWSLKLPLIRLGISD